MNVVSRVVGLEHEYVFGDTEGWLIDRTRWGNRHEEDILLVPGFGSARLFTFRITTGK
jgi:hypothetical protein